MPDELTTGTESSEQGQSTAEPEGTPAAEPQDAGGQPGEGAATTKTGTPAEPNEFFDPQEYAKLTKDLPPELQKQAKLLQKELQGSYTKKTQAIADARQKIQAFDAFQANPVEAMQQMAGRMGYKLTRAEAAQAVQEQQQWEPKSWDEVMDRATQKAQQNIMQSLQPVLGQFVEQRKSNIESQLSQIDPGWQQHEERMIANLQKHPTLKDDPATLYRLSVPPEVQESRATQAALRKMEGKTNAARIGGASTTNRQPPAHNFDKPMSFNEAVQAAKAQIAEQGR